MKQLVLPWTTDTPEVEQYARMITAGQLSGLEATLQLDQIEQWQKAIEVRGTLAGVAMTLKRPDLPIRDLSATLALAQGKLSAEGVKAATGNSAVHDGRIGLDFTAAPMTIAANTRWQADLSQVLALDQTAARASRSREARRAARADRRGPRHLHAEWYVRAAAHARRCRHDPSASLARAAALADQCNRCEGAFRRQRGGRAGAGWHRWRRAASASAAARSRSRRPGFR